MKPLAGCILIVVFCASVALFAQFGYSSTAGSPTSECFVCHKNPAGSADLLLKGVPERYGPGKTYKLTLTVKSALLSAGESQGGFTARVTAGELGVTDEKNTQLSDTVITHTRDGAALRTWQFTWTAPREKIPVNLRVMAVAANGDFSPNGEAIAARSLTINPPK